MGMLVKNALKTVYVPLKLRYTPFFLYKREGKFTPASIMLSFLRILGSNYAYDMLNISFLRKFWK